VAVDGVAADDEPFDEHVRAAQEDLAILEGARLAFVGVDDEVLGSARLLATKPTSCRWGSPSAAAAQVDFPPVDDLLRLHLSAWGAPVPPDALYVASANCLLVQSTVKDAVGHHFRSVVPVSAAVVFASGPVCLREALLLDDGPVSDAARAPSPSPDRTLGQFQDERFTESGVTFSSSEVVDEHRRRSATGGEAGNLLERKNCPSLVWAFLDPEPLFAMVQDALAAIAQQETECTRRSGAGRPASAGTSCRRSPPRGRGRAGSPTSPRRTPSRVRSASRS